MELKFNESPVFKGWYIVEEDFKDTDSAVHEVLGIIFDDEFGYHWNIEPDYSGIICTNELEQIVKFMQFLEVKNDGKKDRSMRV